MERVHVGACDDLAPGDIVSVESAAERIAVCNVEGEFYAVSDMCTHAEAWLSDGWLDGAEIVCPYHMGRFSAQTGAVTCLPATRPLATYRVEAVDGELYVEVP